MFNYKWNLKDGYPAQGVDHHGLKVFGTFICGGGSTMGYKLAGYHHLGGVEIDSKVARIYKLNHNPEHLYVQDLREFNKRTDLPDELFSLDLLDGSPPCSTFSMAGSRENAWGKEKKFREGQAEQTLDDLVFVYIETIAKLKPKVCILENVKGIIQGNAKYYSKEIVRRMNEIGYDVQVFLLNAASMGVPQRRERVFFIGRKKELNLKNLKLEFNEKPIQYWEVEKNTENKLGAKISDAFLKWWVNTPKGKSLSVAHPKGSFFNSVKISDQDIIPTITSTNGAKLIHYKEPNEIGDDCIKMCGSYPLDYDFQDIEPKYLIGMSVPPVMTAQIAYQIYIQWFKI